MRTMRNRVPYILFFRNSAQALHILGFRHTWTRILGGWIIGDGGELRGDLEPAYQGTGCKPAAVPTKNEVCSGLGRAGQASAELPVVW